MGQTVRNPPAVLETRVRFLGCKEPLKKGMATHSSILAWRITWPTSTQTRFSLASLCSKACVDALI